MRPAPFMKRPPVSASAIHILHRLGYYLRAARGGSRVTDADAGAAIGMSGQTVARRLAAPHLLKLHLVLELFEVYDVDPGEALTRAVEDAQKGRGLPDEETAAQILADLKP